MIKVTKTLGQLHFSDLSYERFEDLCLAMVYRLNRWMDIDHFGRKGKERGVDIHAIEEMENGKKLIWHVQCKRYNKIAKPHLKEIIDKIVTQNETKPNVLLLIVACDISRNNIEYFKRYAISKGIEKPLIWTAAIIETKLYAEYHDLLFMYFDITLAAEKREKIASIRRNIKIKQKMRKEFIVNRISPEESIRYPWKRFISSEVIIHSIYDVSYPNHNDDEVGISPWLKLEIQDFYFNGIEVLLGIKEIIIDDQNNWDVLEYNDSFDEKRFLKQKVYYIGRIPFENIIEYDLYGDEYYSQPHIYCDYRYNGMPYEEFCYYAVYDTYFSLLDNKKRKK
jgi:hypothetical protein